MGIADAQSMGWSGGRRLFCGDRRVSVTHVSGIIAFGMGYGGSGDGFRRRHGCFGRFRMGPPRWFAAIALVMPSTFAHGAMALGVRCPLFHSMGNEPPRATIPHA